MIRFRTKLYGIHLYNIIYKKGKIRKKISAVCRHANRVRAAITWVSTLVIAWQLGTSVTGMASGH
jgi:hypothetical protein